MKPLILSLVLGSSAAFAADIGTTLKQLKTADCVKAAKADADGKFAIEIVPESHFFSCLGDILQKVPSLRVTRASSDSLEATTALAKSTLKDPEVLKDLQSISCVDFAEMDSVVTLPETGGGGIKAGTFVVSLPQQFFDCANTIFAKFEYLRTTKARQRARYGILVLSRK